MDLVRWYVSVWIVTKKARWLSWYGGGWHERSEGVKMRGGENGGKYVVRDGEAAE